MSLPPFLFSAAAPTTARSAFAATTATVSAGGVDPRGMGTELNFRQAFMQLTQNNASLEGTLVSQEVAADPLLAKLNLLLEGDLLPVELQESLRSFIEDLQEGVPVEDAGTDLALTDLLQQADLPEDQLNSITAMLQDAVADVTTDVQQSPEVVEVLRDLVDLLTSGKSLPVNPPSDAMNLSEEVPPVDSHFSPVMSPAPISPEASVTLSNLTGNAKSPDLLQNEPGKRLDLSQWIAGQEEEPASGQPLKPEVLASASKPSGFPADVIVKPDIATSTAGAILPPDLDLPESASGSTAPAIAVAGKAGLIAGLQAPAETQMHSAMRVQVAFGHAQWSEAVAERAAWLAGQQIHSAELQLDPPELGPLQVRVSVHQDQAVVSFVSASPQVRDALDQSMARLRELLQEQGMQLVDAGVSDQKRGGDGDSGGGDTPEGLASGNIAGEGPEIDATPGDMIDARYGVDDFV